MASDVRGDGGVAKGWRAILLVVSSRTPTGPDAASDESIEAASSDWLRFLGSVKKAAEKAWARGDHFFGVYFIERDGSPKFAKPEDAAGAIEAIESMGWEVVYPEYTNASGMGRVLLGCAFHRVPDLASEIGADFRALLEGLTPSAREHFRKVLIRDQADRDAVASQLLRYRDEPGDDWADIIDGKAATIATLDGEPDFSRVGEACGCTWPAAPPSY